MLTVLIRHLAARGVAPIGLLSTKRQSLWHVPGASIAIDMQDYFRTGSWLDAFRFASIVSTCEAFYVLGADVLDGFYGVDASVRRLRLLQLASQLGVHAAAIGFSFSEDAPPVVIDALRDVPKDVRLCVRDPISHSFLEGVLGRTVELTADLAFLLEPDEASERIRSLLAWVDECRHQGRLVLGINANHHLLRIVPGLTTEGLVGAYAELLTAIQNDTEPLSFCLIPHDSRGTPNDADLAQAIMKAIPDAVRLQTRIHPFTCTAAEVKAVVGHLDCVFTGKMHLAIACLGSGTPAGCVTYKDKKFDGMFRHFGLTDVTIGPETVLRPASLLQFVLDLLKRRTELRSAILAALPRVRNLAERNFADAVKEAIHGG